jgi:hypothetical protein
LIGRWSSRSFLTRVPSHAHANDRSSGAAGVARAYFSSRSCWRINSCTSCIVFKRQFWLVSLVPKDFDHKSRTDDAPREDARSRPLRRHLCAAADLQPGTWRRRAELLCGRLCLPDGSTGRDGRGLLLTGKRRAARLGARKPIAKRDHRRARRRGGSGLVSPARQREANRCRISLAPLLPRRGRNNTGWRMRERPFGNRRGRAAGVVQVQVDSVNPQPRLLRARRSMMPGAVRGSVPFG